MASYIQEPSSSLAETLKFVAKESVQPVTSSSLSHEVKKEMTDKEIKIVKSL